MKKHIKFPEIGQFREAVASINRSYQYVGQDENGEAMFDPSIKKPTLIARGTCKCHGTNASVCYNYDDGFWVQSRTNIITVEKDNAGFAFYAESKKELFIDFIEHIARENDIDLNVYTISIFGEWAGQGIQRGVAINNIEKSLFVFGVKVSKPGDEGFKSYWLPHGNIKSPENRIYNIEDFQTFEIEIDFSKPQLAQNEIIEMTKQVEEECPVAKHFGHSGIGEGIVFAINFKGNNLSFKSKGEKHSKSKVKTLKKVDNEKLQKIMDVADQVTPIWRLEQMMFETFDLNNGGTIDRAKLGDYIRAVIKDVMKEEMDVIAAANLEPKDVNKNISIIARDYFFEWERNDLGVE